MRTILYNCTIEFYFRGTNQFDLKSINIFENNFLYIAKKCSNLNLVTFFKGKIPFSGIQKEEKNFSNFLRKKMCVKKIGLINWLSGSSSKN